MMEEEPVEEEEEGVEVAKPLPLALIIAEAARIAIRDMREKLAEMLDQLNKRLARPRVIHRGADWVGREHYILIKRGPLGEVGRRRVVIHY